LTFSLNTLGITQATGSSNGYLSSADWTTFNNKQSALTNPVTGTGTTNYLPKFTGTSAIGNSLIYDNGTNVGINNTSPSYKLDVTGTGRFTTSSYFATSSGNVGIGGLVPNAWNSIFKVLEIGNLNSSVYARTDGFDQLFLGTNHYYSTGGAYLYANSGKAAQRFYLYDGEFVFQNAPIGTAGNAITWAQPLTIASTGAATFSSSVTAGTQFIGNNTITDPTVGITNATVYALNGPSSNNTFGIGIGAVRNGAYDMWFQTGAINGGGYRWYIGTSEKMTITSGGNVGIGTTSPDTNLQAIGGISARTNTTGDAFYRLYLDSNIVGHWYADRAGSKVNIGSVTSIPLVLETAGTERMRITSGGNVGIGTTSPSTRLQVTGGDVTFDATGGNANLVLVKSASYDASIYFLTASAYKWVQGTNGDDLTFTSLVGGLNERMRIKSSGIINLSNVPSSSAGLSSGDIYKTVAGVLMIV
jgi:hypothetical protein